MLQRTPKSGAAEPAAGSASQGDDEIEARFAGGADPARQDFDASVPNEKWVGDITYQWTNEGWLYLAVVIGLYAARLVIGWAMAERMRLWPWQCDALRMALWRRRKPRYMSVHSYRESQPRSLVLQEMRRIIVLKVDSACEPTASEPVSDSLELTVQ